MSRGPTAGGVAQACVAVALALATARPTPARALEIEGEWPADERVTVRVEDEPTIVALRRVLDAAGLDLVSSWSDERRVSLDVTDRPVEEVVRAVLGAAAPVVLRREGSLVTVESGARPPTPAELEALPDRVTFGDDVVVVEGERVRDVVTLGGDVVLAGEARNVVTLGGDLHVRATGVVHGDVVTAGGEVTRDEGGRITRGGVQFGPGGVVVQGEGDGAPEDRWPREGWQRHDGALSVVGRVFRSLALGALLFLLGLAAVGLAPERTRKVQAGIVRAPLRAGFAGLGVLLGGALVAALLFVTLLGIPLAVLVLLLGLGLAFLGASVTASVLGAALPVERLRGRPVGQLATGVAALLVVSLVPLVGGLVMTGAVATGLGALVLTRFGGRDGAADGAGSSRAA